MRRWAVRSNKSCSEPDTIASQLAPPHRPRAYRGRPRCAWSWFWRSWAIPEINDYHGWIWHPVSLCSINYWGSVGVLGPRRGPTADPHVPLVPMKSFEKRWKAKTTHEMIHETYETVMKKNSEKLWKLMKNFKRQWNIQRILMTTLKIEQNEKHRKYTNEWEELIMNTQWKAMKKLWKT